LKKDCSGFKKRGTGLAPSDKAQLDMYVQQALTRGKTSDVKRLFRLAVFYDSFTRIKTFLPKEVKSFREEDLGDRKNHA
jgi:hypothetical protein